MEQKIKFGQELTLPNNFKIVAIDFKWGVLNENNELICPLKYYAIEYQFDYFIVMILNINGLEKAKFGIMNMEGVEVIACVHPVENFDDIVKKYKLKLLRIAKLKTIV
jgi:hypothetical protein